MLYKVTMLYPLKTITCYLKINENKMCHFLLVSVVLLRSLLSFELFAIVIMAFFFFLAASIFCSVFCFQQLDYDGSGERSIESITIGIH